MKIVVATHNLHKIREIRDILGMTNIPVDSLAEIGFDRDIDEPGNSYDENARIKTETAFEFDATNIVLGDDSGLEIDYLNGEPGIYSARFGGSSASQEDKNTKILELMHGLPPADRCARFVCVVCCIIPGGKMHFFRGVCNGSIIAESRGQQGFGYDPIFLPDGFDRTFAELSADIKNEVSHRARAFQLAKEFLAGLQYM